MSGSVFINHNITQPKIAGGGGQSSGGSEGHPADDDLASEKGHLLAKMGLFSTITGGGELWHSSLNRVIFIS